MAVGVRRVSDGDRSGRARRVRSRAEWRYVRAAPVDPRGVRAGGGGRWMPRGRGAGAVGASCCRHTQPRSTRCRGSSDRDRIASCSCRAITMPPCSFPRSAAGSSPPWRRRRAASRSRRAGYWVSADGKIYAEHGHQIGLNAHRFEAWPSPFVTRGGMTTLERPWGEQTVQPLYNRLEERFPLVDNFGLAGAGSQVRVRGRGRSGRG